jgi:periplasmic divalent cation tolerance protein
MTAILVMSNWPDRETASRVAEQLVEGRLAACVNLLAPCRSIYHWQGKTESAEEIPMLIKTTEARYAEVEQWIRGHHPYELPEILSVPISGGLPDYLQWVHQETA